MIGEIVIGCVALIIGVLIGEAAEYLRSEEDWMQRLADEEDDEEVSDGDYAAAQMRGVLAYADEMFRCGDAACDAPIHLAGCEYVVRRGDGELFAVINGSCTGCDGLITGTLTMLEACQVAALQQWNVMMIQRGVAEASDDSTLILPDWL